MMYEILLFAVGYLSAGAVAVVLFKGLETASALFEGYHLLADGQTLSTAMLLWPIAVPVFATHTAWLVFNRKEKKWQQKS